MARNVEIQRASVGEMNLMRGMSRAEASSVVEPGDCTNALRLGFQKRAKTSW
jgi:hypothetical protein